MRHTHASNAICTLNKIDGEHYIRVICALYLKTYRYSAIPLITDNKYLHYFPGHIKRLEGVCVCVCVCAELEPANLQWSGQKFELDYNLLMCYGITSLPILWSLGIHTV